MGIGGAIRTPARPTTGPPTQGDAPERRRGAARRLYDLALDLPGAQPAQPRRASRAVRGRVGRPGRRPRRPHDPRRRGRAPLVQVATARSRRRSCPSATRTRTGARHRPISGRRSAAPRSMVQFYDPTDLFGDLAEALAERTRPSRRRRTSSRSKRWSTPRRARTRRSPHADALTRATGRRNRAIDAELLAVREYLPGRWLQTYAAQGLAAGARPGQYLHVRPPGGLGRPDATTGHAPRRRPGTRRVDRPSSARPTRPGDGLRPCGHRNGSTSWGRSGGPCVSIRRTHHLLLIADGDGVAALRPLADDALAAGRQVTLLFGADSIADVYPSSLLPDEVEYVVATTDGSLGHRGSVIELVEGYEAWADQAFAVGTRARAGASRAPGERARGPAGCRAPRPPPGSRRASWLPSGRAAAGSRYPAAAHRLCPGRVPRLRGRRDRTRRSASVARVRSSARTS